ncbi:MAG TPA: PDGLE domain-containing protein [Actinophytocola sp.]|uniref:PDGLE domain-containing protein n=1 Tax=Actinophytocola sp. TaxID=1872138 RepID=UPI002DBE97DE|nr:PDGLE domain-containing protein [Actinophytocola sp.]HEU5471881.1 PDGLE domain-containing protein [Actinophytocola sp.]
MNDRRRQLLFFVGFVLVALVLAGVASYFADDDPDGLDAATEEIAAKNGQPHALENGLFADYAVAGDDRFTGVAGVLGVLVTLVVAGGLFTVLRKRSRS